MLCSYTIVNPTGEQCMQTPLVAGALQHPTLPVARPRRRRRRWRGAAACRTLRQPPRLTPTRSLCM